jgi:hypothetical protein
VNDKDQTQDVKFVDDHRWELASTFLSRSDHSAEVFRAALLAIATAAIGFVMQNENLAAHIMSLVLFVLSPLNFRTRAPRFLRLPTGR